MIQRLLTVSLVALYAATSGSAAQDPNARRIVVLKHAKKLVVTAGGEPFTELHFADGPKPYLHPVLGPGGAVMTRAWPMGEAEDEAHDHPHHRSLWFAHGDVNGHDFWAEGPDKGRIEHQSVLSITIGETATVRTQNRWVTAAGEPVCDDTRTMRFRDGKMAREIDFEVTLTAAYGELTLGDTKEGTLALRLAPTLRLEGRVAAGRSFNSAGDENGACWGKRAEWVDYSGPIGGNTLGVTLFDHPSNPSHPTWWHARDYGLFAANPFGVHDFEKKPAGTGDVVVPEGESITFRYRILLHSGAAQANTLNAVFKRFAAE